MTGINRTSLIRELDTLIANCTKMNIN